MPENRRRFALICQQSTALAAVAAVALSAAGVVELEVVPPSGGTAEGGQGRAGGSLVSAAPVEPTVRSVPFGAGAPTRARAPQASGGSAVDGDLAGRTTLRSAAEAAPGYATVGVSWDPGQPVTEENVEISVRTRVEGAWSRWEEMHLDPEHAPDPVEKPGTVRGGTDALVVGRVEKVRVRVVGRTGGMPEGLRLEVIDPGADVEPAYEGPAIDTAAGAPAGDAELSSAVPEAENAASVAPKPKIFSRGQWGADESLRDKGSLRYGTIRGGFVHHTVNANGYGRGDVPALLRGIYAYHTRSLGWSDIGYNFLVDRFGRLWEGRAGGVARPVVGAHTYGYNDESFAMSAIGNFETTQPSQAMLDAYARLFAWKLSLHGIRGDDPQVRISGKSFAAISGHRDAGQTACPGRYLYAKLGSIRTATAALQKKRVRAPEHNTDISGKGSWPDFVARDRQSGRAVVVRTGGQLAFLEGTRAATGLGAADLLAAPGDVDEDGSADIVARSARTGETTLYRGAKTSGRLNGARTYRRFAGLDQLSAAGDLNGDRNLDLIGRSSAGKALLLFPGRGDGRFRAGVELSANWSRYDLTTGVGDFDGDGNADLVARDGADLYLVPGTGSRDLKRPVSIPGDWSGYDLLAGRGDITGDRVPDLVGRVRASGTTYFIPGDGRGGVGRRLGGTQRYAGHRWLALGSQLVGNRAGDLVTLNRKGAVRVFRNSGGTNIAKVVTTGIDLSGTDLLASVGDWNGDKHGDFMARRGGTMTFYAGRGDDTFAAPVNAGTGWARVVHVGAVGDVTGDGQPDLLGRLANGRVRLYPGNGSNGFRASVRVQAPSDVSAVAGVGRWDGDRNQDVVMRRSDGGLWLFRTNAAGNLGTGSRVGSAARRYDLVLGLGDLDGRARSDLLVRQRATGDLWLLRGRAKGFAPRRLVAEGYGRYDLAG